MLETIKKGTRGDTVRIAQCLTGFASENYLSRDFDAAFDAHMRDWQRNNGLTADGVIGPNTWRMIAKKAPICSTSKNNKGPIACAVQLLIGKLTVDAVFGQKTKQAVAAFQSAAGLTVDGCVGPNTWRALIASESGSGVPVTYSGDGSDCPTINKCVHYVQWDSRWKTIRYSTHTSSQTIGNSGCGPSAMAMIMATFIDKKITPVEMCALAVDAGCRTYNNGTSWDFFPYVFRKYKGFGKYIATSSVETLKAALAQGALAVCSVNSNDNGFWTKGGHFITAIGYDSAGYIYANDPNKATAPRKQLASKFAKCLKQAFIFWPMTAEKPETVEEVNAIRGNKIVDISKWEPEVDYDRLIGDTSLIILRAGYRGTAGGLHVDQAFEKHASELSKRGVPFGVYFYSIAKNATMGEAEANAFVADVGDYKPLFWAIDAEEGAITSAGLTAFAAQMRVRGVERLGCYVAGTYYDDYGYEDLRSLFDFTWIPRYGRNDGTLAGSKKPPYDCDLWQYTSEGTVAGISGGVDLSVVTGTGKTLSWLLGGEE